MKITLDKTKTIRDVQKEFSESFPFLKIEFFTRPHSRGMGSEKKHMKDGAALLADLNQTGSSGEIHIAGEMTVAQLEQMFEASFGLHVQVFRRSGKLWLETTATDNWTLDYQNEQGRELSTGNLSNDREEIDYHEQE